VERKRGKTNNYSLKYPHLYYVWRTMRSRCYDIKHPSYHNYGGRGIGVCEQWIYNSQEFCDWAMSNGWEKGLHLDRINNNISYSPENCHFVTPKENVDVGKKRMKSNNTSGYNGVDFYERKELWRARIHFNKKEIHIGWFSFLEDAVEARIAKEIELFGEQKTNFHYMQKSKKYQ
jgi:hypothetical protein